MSKVFLLLCVALTSCASRPSFRKLEQGQGYEVKEGFTKEFLEIFASLPPGTNARFAETYLLRAAGEECLLRGFAYFAHAQLTETSLKAVCSEKAERRSLGLQFDPKSALEKPPRLRVFDTLPGSHSPLRPNDLVKKIGGRAVKSPGEILEREFFLQKENQKSVSVLVERSEILLSLEARLIETEEGMMGPERLQLLRQEAP